MTIPYPVLSDMTTYSASFWIKDFSQGVLFSGIGGYADYHRPRLYVTDSQKVEFNTRNYYTGKQYQFSYDCTSIMSSEWHQIVVSCNNGNNTLFVDGKKVEEIKSSAEKSPAPKFNIGGNSNGAISTFMGMKVDNVSFYDVCLTEDNVKYMYDNKL